jgi:hypothetical protein
MHSFNITEKGLKFLEIYNKLNQAANGGREEQQEEEFVPSSYAKI